MNRRSIPCPRCRHRAGVALVLLLAVAAACARSETDLRAEEQRLQAHAEEILAWREKRDAGLRRPDGWLSLAGLYWLHEGDNSLGTAPEADLVFPEGKAAADLGVLRLRGGVVEFLPAPGGGVAIDGEEVSTPRTLITDAEGEPTELHTGTLSFTVIERSSRLAVRLRDSENPPLLAFQGMDYFPVDPDWRVVARFEPFDPPKMLQVPNITGMVDAVPSPGVVSFTVDGEEYRLEPTREGDELFFVFSDATNGEQTYPAGRMLYTPLPDADGRLVLDFNRAYTPPCVFTPYATCPLPTPENRLSVAVRAGELDYAGAFHHS